jgi:hypothetical protein
LPPLPSAGFCLQAVQIAGLDCAKQSITSHTTTNMACTTSASLRAQGHLNVLGHGSMPKTWPNALLLQFVDRESFETAYAEDVIITFEGHGFPDMPARPDDLDNAISARRIDLGSEITLLVKRFIGYRRDKYDNALLVELGGLIDIRLAIATGRIRLVPDATRDYELACELSEHQRRLQNDPAFFAFIAMQNSITKHDNTRSAARDWYFFGPTLFMAINDRTEKERLFAMASLTESPHSPFLDARLNQILQALRDLEVRNPGTTGLSALAETLQMNGHLESVGGVCFLERKLRDPVRWHPSLARCKR